MIGTMIAAATPPKLPAVLPTSPRKLTPSKSPEIYLCTASTRNVATAALAIPDIASDPFGAFILNSENAASVTNNNPNPDITAILLPPLSFAVPVPGKCEQKKTQTNKARLYFCSSLSSNLKVSLCFTSIIILNFRIS